MLSKVWDEIIYPFPIFNGVTAEVWEWIRNFVPHFKMGVINRRRRHHHHFICMPKSSVFLADTMAVCLQTKQHGQCRSSGVCDEGATRPNNRIPRLSQKNNEGRE